MVSLDLEFYEPHLRKIKVHSLDPELMQDVLEVANELGLEVTVTSSSNLDFLFRSYHAEKSKKCKDRQKLEKAEDLILKLAGFYTLKHGKSKRTDKEEKKPFQGAMPAQQIPISHGIRSALQSIGIDDEHQMRLTVEQIGEPKIEQRVSLVRKTSLPVDVIRGVFSENPDTLRMPEDGMFAGELMAMEHKMEFLDAWRETSGQELPLWADYGFSPPVLLSDYQSIVWGLGVETPTANTQIPQGDYPHISAEYLHKILEHFGFSRTGTGGIFVFEHPAGRTLTISDPDNGFFDPAAVARIIADIGGEVHVELLEEKTAPAHLQAKKKSTSPLTRNPSGDGLKELLAIFHERGIDVSSLSSSQDIISSEIDSGSDTAERNRFESLVTLLSDLIFAHDLEKKINTNLGTEGFRVVGVKYLTGARGAFELRMNSDTESRRIYLNMQDMGPATIGVEAVEVSGMLSSRIWTRTPAAEYVTSEGHAYGVSEDARDLGKRGRLRLRMPDLSFEDVETKGAAMFMEDVVLRPDMSDDLHKEFYAMLADEEGRKRLLRSLFAYFEMSRRTLLADRRPPNTCLLRVTRESGETEFTFQPTDLDGIGNFIGRKDSAPDFTEFNNDFYKSALYFAIQMHEGMLRAGMSDVPSVKQLLADMEELSHQPFPEDEPRTMRAREQVFREHNGSHIGIGFDASQHIGMEIPAQGTEKEIVREDGRLILDADAMIGTASAAAEVQKQYLEGMRGNGSERIAKTRETIAHIAFSITKTHAMPEKTADQRIQKSERLCHLFRRTGGEIAARITRMPDFPGSGDEAEIKSFAQAAAAKELSG
jgi:hypothetical protein